MARSALSSQNAQNTAIAERSSDVQKSHAAVARSTFVSQNVEKLIFSCRFWQIRSGKMVCRFGAKRIYKSKCTKHRNRGAIFEVQMSKNRTPLWREAHCQVKMCKTPHSRATFRSSDVQKSRAAVARSTFVSQNVEKLIFWCTFWKISQVVNESISLLANGINQLIV